MENGFRHQRYTDGPPSAQYELLEGSICDDDRTLTTLAPIGEHLAASNVRAIYLVHGTFAGGDTFGVARQLQRHIPGLGRLLAIRSKQLFDLLAKNLGNFSKRYAQLLSEGLNAKLATPIEVKRFHWTGQNLHIGRADGAVRLIDQLAARRYPSGSRILLVGHSHAGNVFALVSNLLGGHVEARHNFFRAARSYYRSSFSTRTDLPAWDQAIEVLTHRRLEEVSLDFVTFGTPIRYGWNSGGFGKLLHIVFHRPQLGLPEYRSHFPPRLRDLMRATGGDYIQQLGVAGTNEISNIFAWRQWQAERRLNRLLQSELGSDLLRRDLLQRLRKGQRVANSGKTLLVDYSCQGRRKEWSRIAGHAVYTHTNRMAFHFNEISERLYV